MALEITLPQNAATVQLALMQFAARRGYSLSSPGHLDGHCIENALLPTPARVEVRMKRSGDETLVDLAFGDNPESVQLAYALQGYLSDEKAYACECPPICPKCSALVGNVASKFCGRCGASLMGDKPGDSTDAPRQEREFVTVKK